MRLRRSAALTFLTLAVLGAAAALPSQAAELAAHRAVYTLRLETARGDISGATGTMAYEVQDACDGWAVRQRLQMTVTNRDGQDTDMLSDYTTWESKDGLHLRFRTKQTTDQAVTQDLAGDANLEKVGAAGTAHYTSPEDKTEPLPAGTLFPMRHTEALLRAAQDGKKFVALPLFDGTSENGAQDSFVVVVNWHGPKPDKWPDLAKLPSGRFHIGFFDKAVDSITPDYEVGMRYWSNGVADDLDMDFGDFVMSGKLTEFTLLPKGC
jgi:hypothetical protein